MNTNQIAAILVGLGSLAGTAAHAVVDDSATMDVSATVNRTCTVTNEALAFEDLEPSGNNDAVATVTITCTAASAGGNPTVAFDMGEHDEGDQRNMSGGDGITPVLVPYSIHLGPSAAGAPITTEAISASTSNGGLVYSATISGRVVGSAAYPLGDYEDAMILTVTYDGEAGAGLGS